jgi:hypothetical protein
MAARDELKILIPAEEVETSQGTVTLHPFKFRDFPKALGLVSKYLEAFMQADGAYAIAQILLADSGEETITDVGRLIELSSGKDRAYLDELTWDEVVQILVVIIQQNIDFFYRIGTNLGETIKHRQPELQQTAGEKASAA